MPINDYLMETIARLRSDFVLLGGIDNSRFMADLQKSIQANRAFDEGATAALAGMRKELAASADLAKSWAATMPDLNAVADVLGHTRLTTELQKTIQGSLALDEGATAALARMRKELAASADLAKSLAATIPEFRTAAATLTNARLSTELQKTIQGSLALDEGATAALARMRKELAASADLAKSWAATIPDLHALAAVLGDTRLTVDLQRSIQDSLALDEGATAAFASMQRAVAAAAKFEARIPQSIKQLRRANAANPTAADYTAAARIARHVRNLVLWRLKSVLSAAKNKAGLIHHAIEILLLLSHLHALKMNGELLQAQSELRHELQHASGQMRSLEDDKAPAPEALQPAERKHRHRPLTHQRSKHKLRRKRPWKVVVLRFVPVLGSCRPGTFCR